LEDGNKEGRKMKICIDPGHGGKDSGAVGNGRKEKTDTLKMGKALRLEMLNRGHSVLMTRVDDSYPSLNARADMANNWGADVFISIHRNAPVSGKGYEVLYGKNASQKSIRMGQLYIDYVIPVSGFTARRNGRPFQQGATVLQRSKMPANTVEVGFVGNATDDAILDSKLDAIIKAHADALEAMFGAVGGAGQEEMPKPSAEVNVAFIKEWVTGLYKNVLGRDPDTAGLNNWVNAIANKTVTPAAAAEGFLMSDENIGQEESNETYVRECYAGPLMRTADDAGFAEWKKGLYTNMSRLDVFNGIVDSAEFALIVERMGL
jgi:hypothetical protein